VQFESMEKLHASVESVDEDGSRKINLRMSVLDVVHFSWMCLC
jgi:hypothetical protein